METVTLAAAQALDILASGRDRSHGSRIERTLMDITDVILNDHHDQRRMFAILDEMHGGPAPDLAAVWSRLRILLEVHAKAEEVLFYPELLALGAGAGGKDSPEDETTDAIHDHNEIRDAISDVGGHE